MISFARLRTCRWARRYQNCCIGTSSWWRCCIRIVRGRSCLSGCHRLIGFLVGLPVGRRIGSMRIMDNWHRGCKSGRPSNAHVSLLISPLEIFFLEVLLRKSAQSAMRAAYLPSEILWTVWTTYIIPCADRCEQNAGKDDHLRFPRVHNESAGCASAVWIQRWHLLRRRGLELYLVGNKWFAHDKPLPGSCREWCGACARPAGVEWELQFIWRSALQYWLLPCIRTSQQISMMTHLGRAHVLQSEASAQHRLMYDIR